MQSITKITEEAGTSISQMIATARYELKDKNAFGDWRIVLINGRPYHLYVHLVVRGCRIGGTNGMPRFSFAIAVPPADLKKRFLVERAKEANKQPYDKKMIGEYYRGLHSGSRDVDKVAQETAAFMDKVHSANGKQKYSFVLNTICPTASGDFALVYLDANSLIQCAGVLSS